MCFVLFQIKELEEKQAELLRRRSVAQKELKEAEARVSESIFTGIVHVDWYFPARLKNTSA